MTQGALEDLWHGPDYAGQFQDRIEAWDRDGDFGGNALRYSIFSTLNDGRDAPMYQQSLDLARRYYGLYGSSGSPQVGTPTAGGMIRDFQLDVVQPTVGSWLSLQAWLFWFKVGFMGW